MCDKKWIFYDNQQWPAPVVGPRRSSETLPKAKLEPREDRGHCLVTIRMVTAILIHCNFLSPCEAIPSEKCSANQWDTPETTLAAGIGQQKRPDSSPWQRPTTCCITSNASKAELIGLQSFASSAVFTWPFANRLPLPQATWQLFSGRTLLQPAGSRKCFPTVPWILKAQIFMLQE